jgi:PAS domain S-box-containing protein
MTPRSRLVFTAGAESTAARELPDCRRLLELLPDPLILTTADRAILFINPAAAAALSYDHDCLIARSLDDLIAQQLPLPAADCTPAGSAAARCEHWRCAIVCGDGARRTFVIRESRVIDNGATVLVHALRPVDSPAPDRRAAVALEESEERFRVAFHTSPDAININRVDTGRYVDANEGFLRLTGYSRQEIIGRTSLELNIWADPEDRERLVQALSEQGQVRDFEARFRCKDGGIRVGLMSARVTHIDGEPHILSVTRDVSSHKRMVNALRDSERRFRTAFLTSPDSVCITRLYDGAIVDVNEAFTGITGYAREEVIGRRLPDLPLWTDVRDCYRLKEIIEAHEHIENLQLTFCAKDGSGFSGLVSARLIDLDGAPHIVAVTRDITRWQKVTQALRNSEERFRELFGAMRSALIVLEAVHDGADFVITDINHACESLKHVTAADVRGRSVIETFAPYREHGLFKRIRQTWISGEPQHVPPCRYHDSRVSVCVEGYVFRLPTCEVVLILDDITVRRNMEMALRESEQLYRSLVETMNEGLAVRDEHGRITYVNDKFCDMLGYGRDELIGSHPMQLLDDLNRAVLRDQMLRRERGARDPYELQWNHKSGRPVTTIVSPESILDDTGRVVGAFAVFTDITERKAAERLIKQTTEQLDAERRALEEKNIALKQVLAHLEEEKQEFRQTLTSELTEVVTPAMTRLRRQADPALRPDIEVLEQGIRDILAANVDTFRSLYAHLSSREIQVCDLIDAACSSKQISDRLNLSLLTVHKHREAIRRKLGLQGEEVNLGTFLRTH